MKNIFNKQESMNFHQKEYNIKNNFKRNNKINKIDTFKLYKIFNPFLLVLVISLKQFLTFKLIKKAIEYAQWQL
jgi:L-lactate permease